MYCNRQNFYHQMDPASFLILAAVLILASGQEEEDAKENEDESGDPSTENLDEPNSSESQTRGGEAPSFVDPARTGLVDPARTRFVDPART